ncbi:MAG TPA: filamentous hemagglutinin N-terminal domain-containing protein [Thiomonas arsenitoxydans]|nr:filamentous hemagglutinin N-terminal domain-containing protein [Thiomonas arsenitoxydans]
MNHKTMLKLTPVAASLMMALGGVAHAAAPAANALPGTFLTNNSNVTYNIATSVGAITGLSGNAVLQFGGASSATVSAAVVPSLASTATAATAAGFNIGASAALQLNASATGANVLVSDLTGQASNIYGSLTANGSVASLFIANPNGVVVGGTGNISAGNVALVGYQADAASFAATSGGTVTVGVVGAVPPSLTSPGSAGTSTTTANGEVTISNGATVNAGYLLVAGAGQVNVGALNSASTVATLSVAAGSSVTAGSSATLGNAIVSASAVANLGGNTGSLAVANLGAAGAVNVLGSVDLSNATIGGTLTNNANLTLGSATNVAAFTNNANASVGATNVTFGGITNNANLDANSGLTFGGAFVNAGKATVGTLTANSSTASVNNSGTLTGVAGIQTSVASTSAALTSFTNTGTLYDSGAGIQVTAGSINLGGTVANSNTSATIGGVTLVAQTGDLTGSANLNLNSSNVASLTAVKGGINYTGNVNATSFTVSAATGAVALGAVNVGTAGAVVVNAGNGNITLGGNVSASTAGFTAAGGSVLVNKDITATTSATFNADNQIMVYGNVNAGTAGTVNLTTNKVWTGPYNLGVVIMPSGGVVAGTVATTVAGNMLQYGNISAANGFQFTGNSYYQGAGAAINTPAATFGYGNASSGGAIAGGIVFGSANPQPSNAFFNAVVVGGSNATGGVSLDVTPANLGTAMQNVNLMGIGNTTLATAPAVGALFGSTGSTVINTGFVPSNLFIRAQGGNLTLAKNSSGGFYWPGLVYASTVQAGTNATVDTTKTITLGGSLSNALPYQATGGAGIYLMTGKVNVGDITVNTNSNVNVLNPLQVAGLNLYTASAPTGLVLNYSATLPTANVVSYTPPAN